MELKFVPTQRLFDEQVVEELLAVKNAEKKAKRRKKQQSSESACELLRRLDDLGTPIIGAKCERRSWRVTRVGSGSYTVYSNALSSGVTRVSW